MYASGVLGGGEMTALTPAGFHQATFAPSRALPRLPNPPAQAIEIEEPVVIMEVSGRGGDRLEPRVDLVDAREHVAMVGAQVEQLAAELPLLAFGSLACGPPTSPGGFLSKRKAPLATGPVPSSIGDHARVLLPGRASSGHSTHRRALEASKKSVVLAGAEFGCFCTENLLVAHRPVMRKVADNGQLSQCWKL